MASRLIFFALAGLVFLTGCDREASLEILSESEDPVFRRARDLAARGMENEALENFLKLIQKRNGNAPESHLDAGNIYLSHLNDPVSAIYHFKHYEALLRRMGGDDAQERLALIQDQIKRAEKEFALAFDRRGFKDPYERLNLMERIDDLRKENESLKRRVESLSRQLESSPQIAINRNPAPRETTSTPVFRSETQTPQPIRTQTANTGRTYVVKQGDSLYQIAREVYGDASRWKEILEANRDTIPDTGTLKVGARLRIP